MITDIYNDGQGIISPGNLVKKRDDMPRIFISSFSRQFTKILTGNYNASEIGRIHLSGRITVYRIDYDGMSIGYFESPVGAPGAVFAEELIFEMGAESILYFGSCGYIDEALSHSSILIPDRAYRDEGTSYHYAPASDYIDIETSDKLKSIFDILRIPYISGYTWTTDGFFRETPEALLKRKNDGCIAVEMECAALMAAAGFRNRKAYQFLYTADNLTEEEYDADALSLTFPDITGIALRTAKELYNDY